MLQSFLRSSWYNRIATMTQYKNKYYSDSDSDDSDSDDELDSNSDEEKQYHMVRIYDDVIIRYDNTVSENKNKKISKYDFNEADYYFISYEITDTEIERRCKDCLNYGAIGVCIFVHIILVYTIFIIYEK